MATDPTYPVAQPPDPPTHQSGEPFKHGGALPGPDTVELARANVASFFETSTPLVFDDLAYGDIDMADMITQASVKAHVKAATAAAADGDRVLAMACLSEAFEELVRAPGATRRRRSPFSLGPDLHHPMRDSDITAVLSHPDQRGPARGGAQLLGEQISNVTEVVQAVQFMLRITAMGIDYGQYLRFRELTPRLRHHIGTGPTVHPTDDYAPSEDEVDYCQQFVVTASLRVAEATSHLTPPSWATVQ